MVDMSTGSQNSGTSPIYGRVEIARLGVMSIAKIAAAVYATIAVIPGVFVVLGILVNMSTSGGFLSGRGPGFALLFGVGMVIGLPIVYGAMGFIFGALSAWVYNFVASKIGGVVIETRQR